MLQAHRNKIQTGGNARQREAIEKAIRLYYHDPDRYSKSQKRKLAELAYLHGLSFDVESKPLQKGLFDFADTALLGLIPNKWRPYSPGQEYFGESTADKWAGGLGTAAGFVPGVVTGGAALYGGAKLGVAGTRGAATLAGKAKGLTDTMVAGRYAGTGGKIGQAASRVKEAAARARADIIARYNKGYQSVPWAPNSAPAFKPLQIPQFATGSTGRNPQFSFFDLYNR